MRESSLNGEVRAGLLKYASFILTGRPYFKGKLKDKLFKRAEKLRFENPGPVIEEILSDLEKAGYLNDRYLTEAFIRRQLSKGYGPKIISLKLKILGIDHGLALEALKQEAGESAELESIKKYASKYPRLDHRKLISKLYMRGFSSSVIHHLFDSGWIED